MAVHKMSPNPNIGDYLGRGLVQGLQNRYNDFQEKEREQRKQQREREQQYFEMQAIGDALDAAGPDFASKLNALQQVPASVQSKQFAAGLLEKQEKANQQSKLMEMLGLGPNQNEDMDEEPNFDMEQMPQEEGGLVGGLNMAANAAKAPMMQSGEMEEPRMPPQRPSQEMKTPPHMKTRVPAQQQPYSKKQVGAATLLNPALGRHFGEENKAVAKLSKEERDAEREINKENRQIAQKRAEPVITEANELRTSVRQKENALNTAENAVMTGDLSFWTPDNFAELSGYENTRSLKGTQLKTALKDYYISTIGKVRAKGLNQYLETQINDMLQKIGRSRSANLGTTYILKHEKDMEKLYVDTVDKLEDKFDEAGEPLPKNFPKQVQKEMDSSATVLEKNLERRLRLLNKFEKQIDKMPKNNIFMIDPAGNPLFVPDNEELIAKAQKLGAERI